MNTLIKQFAEQAGFDVYGWNEREFQKFAQLIVRECAELSANNAGYNGLNISHKILKHFGVKTK